MEKSKFVISLDFELHWGVFDSIGESYNENILGARKAVPKILTLFEKYDINATWATVGLLFNKSDEDYRKYKPTATPSYEDKSLNAFDVGVGKNEDEDKLHFAHSLIQLIKDITRIRSVKSVGDALFIYWGFTCRNSATTGCKTT